ncbi:MAG TPA: hypothetical protein VFC02_28250 [Anaerolineales bacterium]|nr:hypothetical protein [Anaerolineales bacterium]
MQLEYICDLELFYREEPLYHSKFLLVRPYDGEEGTAYGEGDGNVTGPKIQGSLRWVNHPHRRSDGTMLPDAHGVIVTNDNAVILFTLQGRTVFEQNQGKQLLSVIFESEAESYLWLNKTFCVLEGLIESERMRARVYACQSDLV